jgi:hypothetical protein
MPLDDFLRENKRNIEWLAQQLGCSVQTIYWWRAGRNRPSRRSMRALVQVTGGAVRHTDFPPRRRRSD